MATTTNPQYNYIVERIHKTLTNMVRTRGLEESKDLELDCNGLLSASGYGIRSTYHPTLNASSGQLFFVRDIIFNIRHVSNWMMISQQRQKLFRKIISERTSEGFSTNAK